MYRRCAKGLEARGLWLGSEGALLLMMSLMFVLSGCGSSPSLPESSAPAHTTPAEADDHASARDTSGADEPPPPPEALQRFQDAVALVNSGNLAAAEQAFRSLSTAYPAYSGPLVNLGILQTKDGRLAEAEQTLREAIERNPRNASAYNQLGIVKRLQGEFAAAEQAYVRAIEINPDHANAHLNLGVLRDLYLQQPERALAAFEKYLEVTDSPDERVSAWVKELEVRIASARRAAGAG